MKATYIESDAVSLYGAQWVKLILTGNLGHNMVWKVINKESQNLEGSLPSMSYPLDQLF